VAVGGSTAYNRVTSLPRLVSEAVGLAGSMHFDNSCAPEQGRLLSVLAAGRSGARIGETGTGCGVGLAWMIEATDPSTSFVSIEVDGARAAAAADLYRDFPNVNVVEGNWPELIDHAPFDLLVLDGGGKGKDPGTDAPIDLSDGWLAIGGMVVLDDFTPAGQPGAEQHDPAREHWLNHPCLKATEVRLSPTLATIIGVRIR
jgi:predicted O-methyltransferase YrrM